MPDDTQKRKKAAAIKYDPGADDVPILSAYGEGHVAKRIIQTARDAGVPVMPDAGLASMLARLSVGDEIPPALYEVVAKVLVYVSELDSEYGRRIRGAAGEKG